MCVTGNGVSVTLNAVQVIGTNGRIIRMAEWQNTVEVLDDNSLDLIDGDYAQKCIGGVIQHEAWEFDGVYDPAIVSVLGGVAQSIIVTLPKKEGESTAGTITGDGWLVTKSHGPFETNQRTEGTFALVFEGGSGSPVHAAGSV